MTLINFIDHVGLELWVPADRIVQVRHRVDASGSERWMILADDGLYLVDEATARRIITELRDAT